MVSLHIAEQKDKILFIFDLFLLFIESYWFEQLVWLLVIHNVNASFFHVNGAALALSKAKEVNSGGTKVKYTSSDGEQKQLLYENWLDSVDRFNCMWWDYFWKGRLD